MDEPTTPAIARQRYLDAGGNPQRTPSGLKGDDYMTDEERQEALILGRQIGRQIFNEEYIEHFLQHQNSQSVFSYISGR